MFDIKIGWIRKLYAEGKYGECVSISPISKLHKSNVDRFTIERCWSGFFRRNFPIIVFANLRWNWNLGQLYFVFTLPLNLFFCSTAHINATHRTVQCMNHTKEAMLPTKQFLLHCVVGCTDLNFNFHIPRTSEFLRPCISETSGSPADFNFQSFYPISFLGINQA